MNSMAGGGTILTFPALLFLGVPPIEANATSTIALIPAAGASLMGYRREVLAHRAWLTSLLVPSLVGGALGSVLLLRTPERLFGQLAPLLILFATSLFLIQAIVQRGEKDSAPAPRTRRALLFAGLLQFLVAIYGGYFGAGIGILMLVILGSLGLSDIHAMNGLKNFFGICINIVAALYFSVRGAVNWKLAVIMIAGATLGGYAGARFARHIGKGKARAAVVIIGFAVTAALLLETL